MKGFTVPSHVVDPTQEVLLQLISSSFQEVLLPMPASYILHTLCSHQSAHRTLNRPSVLVETGCAPTFLQEILHDLQVSV